MKTTQILATLAVVGTVATIAVLNVNSVPEAGNFLQAAGPSEQEQVFIDFMARYGKSYGTKAEFEHRFKIFSGNYHHIMRHNMQNTGSSHRLGLNQFADLSAKEYKKLLGYKPTANKTFNYESVASNGNPASVDWRKTAVTPVKNQGQCGSCWAFSTTGSVEGAYAIAKGELISLSEQQLVDCSKSGPDGNQGCNGGDMDLAFQYFEQNKAEKESDYPYEAYDDTCRYDASKGVFELSGFADVPQNSTQELENAVAKGPVSVAIEADQFAFQLYTSGVISSGCGTNLDHGVLVVGYGTEENGQDYWILKNSWGAGWGEKGYFRIAKGGDGPGVCGLQMSASYPKV